MNEQRNTCTHIFIPKNNFFNYLNIILLVCSPFLFFGQQLDFDHLNKRDKLLHIEIDDFYEKGFGADQNFMPLKNQITREEIDGTIWVEDSTHGYVQGQTRWRSFVLERDKNGNSIHNLSLYSRNTSVNGPWLISSQRFSKFDDRNNEIHSLYQKWDKDIEQWVNYSRQEYKYNLNNQYSYVLSQSWDTAKMKWIDRRKSELKYNNNGNLIHENHQYWKSNSLKDGFSTANYKYKNNLLDERIGESWISIINSVVKSKVKYTYNDHDLLINEYSSKWDSTILTWKGSREKIYTYNSKDSLIEYIIIHWRETESKWIEFTRKTNVYDINNNLIEFVWRRYNRSKKQYYNFVHEISDFNNKNQLIKKKVIYQEIIDSLETIIFQETYLNNADGLPIYVLHEDWEESMQDWINRSQSFYQYDMAGHKIEDLTTGWNITNAYWTLNELRTYNYDEVGHELEEIIYNLSGSGWKEVWSVRSFWSEFKLTDVEEIEHKYLYVYPNPTTDKVFINDGDLNNHYSVNVFNMNGQLRHSSVNTQEVNLGHLASGTYFLQLKWNSGEKTIKLIKE